MHNFQNASPIQVNIYLFICWYLRINVELTCKLHYLELTGAHNSDIIVASESSRLISQLFNVIGFPVHTFLLLLTHLSNLFRHHSLSNVLIVCNMAFCNSAKSLELFPRNATLMEGNTANSCSLYRVWWCTSSWNILRPAIDNCPRHTFTSLGHSHQRFGFNRRLSQLYTESECSLLCLHVHTILTLIKISVELTQNVLSEDFLIET